MTNANSQADTQANTMDGSQLAVLTARLEGIARKMANTLYRTGRSGILTIARDFSCVVLTAKHELLATAESSCRKFSALRSAVSRARPSASIAQRTCPAAMRSPSSAISRSCRARPMPTRP